MTDEHTFNVRKFVDAAGGLAEVSRMTGRTRGGVHYWIRNNRMSSVDLLSIHNRTGLNWLDFIDRPAKKRGKK